jgi:hypothetical protein
VKFSFSTTSVNRVILTQLDVKLVFQSIVESDILAQVLVLTNSSGIMSGISLNDLPEELVVNILQRLPVPVMCQMRCVCKRWNLLPRSPLYVNLSSQATLEKPYLSFLVIERGQLALSLFSPRLGKWYKRPLTFLRNFFIFPTRECHFVAGHGGLFCIASTVNDSCIFIVVNPISKRWRKLPPIPHQRPSFYFRGMHVDRKSRTYKLIVRGRIEGSDHWKTNVYDSATQSWRVGSDMPPGFGNHLLVDCTFCNGKFYCFDNGRSNTLRAYDVCTGVWSEVEEWRSSLSGKFSFVKGYGGLMVWRQLGDWPFGLKNFEVMRLNQNSSEWVKVETTPIETSLQAFFRITRFDLCTGAGDLAYFSIFEDRAVLVYDFAQQLWSLVLVCPKTVAGTCFDGVFALNPGFDFPV